MGTQLSSPRSPKRKERSLDDSDSSDAEKEKVQKIKEETILPEPQVIALAEVVPLVQAKYAEFDPFTIQTSDDAKSAIDAGCDPSGIGCALSFNIRNRKEDEMEHELNRGQSGLKKGAWH